LIYVGLLTAHSGVPLRAILEGDSLFVEFKGALTEQYVDQELHLRDNLDMGYWSNDASQAEVDFIIQTEGSIFLWRSRLPKTFRPKACGLTAIGLRLHVASARRFPLIVKKIGSPTFHSTPCQGSLPKCENGHE
jgi:hypothetical protein